jgi:hypothetical protein
MIFSILVTLHIITAAAWFGLGLRLAGRARAVLAQGGEAGIALANDGAATVRQMNIFAILTLVFSLGAFVAGGHFAVYGPLYHTSVTLIVLFAADQLFVIRPGWKALQTVVTGDGAPSLGADAVDAARKKVAIGTGVGHLLWVVMLVLMLWNRYLGVYF